MFQKGDRVTITGNGGEGFIRHHLVVGSKGEVADVADTSVRVLGPWEADPKFHTSQWVSIEHLRKTQIANNNEATHLLESDY